MKYSNLRRLAIEPLETREVLSVTLPLAVSSLDAQSTADTQTIAPVPLSASTMFANPDIGYQTFYESAASDPNVKAGSVASKVAYYRFNWSQIEPTLGNYNFTAIDQALAAAVASGQKFAFRIMAWEEGDKGPSAYAGLSQLKFTCPGTSGTVAVPNYNDPTTLSYIVAFVRALGTRYGTNPNLSSVDIGLVGRWGEWHYYQCSPAPAMPTTAAWKTLFDAFEANFSCPIMMISAMAGDGSSTNLTAWNYGLSQGFGWRDDSWGDFSWEQPFMDNYVLPNAPNAWKNGPVIMEPSDTMASWSTSDWQKAFAWAITNHVSQFSNKGTTIPSSMLPSLQAMLAQLGYRFVLNQAVLPTTATVGSTVTTTLSWSNVGNAPSYIPQDVFLKIGNTVIDTGSSLTGFLPGSRIDTLSIPLTGMAAGTYAISIGVGTPGSTTPNVALAIQGGVNNWYSLGSLTVTAATSVPPRVTGVYVRGTDWSESFLQGLAAAGLGDATLGYRVSADASLGDVITASSDSQLDTTALEQVTATVADALPNSPSTSSTSTSLGLGGSRHTASRTIASSAASSESAASGSSSISNLGAAFPGGLASSHWQRGASTFIGGNSMGGSFGFRSNTSPKAGSSGSSLSGDLTAAFHGPLAPWTYGQKPFGFKTSSNGYALSSDTVSAPDNSNRLPAANQTVASIGMSTIAGDRAAVASGGVAATIDPSPISGLAISAIMVGSAVRMLGRSENYATNRP